MNKIYWGCLLGAIAKMAGFLLLMGVIIGVICFIATFNLLGIVVFYACTIIATLVGLTWVWYDECVEHKKNEFHYKKDKQL